MNKILLIITLIASVVSGVIASQTTDEVSQYWTNVFYISIAYPIFLIILQVIIPIFRK
jgi:hypothetical protein